VAILPIFMGVHLVGNNIITQSTEDDTTPANQENPKEPKTGDTTSPIAQDNQEGSTTGDNTSPTTPDNHEGQFFGPQKPHCHPRINQRVSSIRSFYNN
jgi:hypothetical protein